MSLIEREKRFTEVCDRFNSNRPGQLIAFHVLPDSDFLSLKTSAMMFISKSISPHHVILNESHILEQIETIDNMTPNGKILPKSYSSLEYNLFLKSVVDILLSLNISDLFSLLRMPVLRYKPAISVNNNRDFSTEIPHLEAWYGHSQDTITIQIPLLGDLEGNYTKLLSPPTDFEESWLKPLQAFRLGKDIASRYISKDIINHPGTIKFFESSTLHQTVRKPHSGSRVSMDMMLVCKKSIHKSTTPQYTLRTVDFGLPPHHFLDFGTKTLFLPKDTMSGYIEKEGLITLDPQ